MKKKFNGSVWRSDAIKKLKKLKKQATPPVWVILFSDDNGNISESTRISAKEKVKAFTEANIPIELVTDENWNNYAKTKRALLSSRIFKIVQSPLPSSLSEKMIKNDLDLDIENGFRWPAVCEATRRVLLDLGGREKPIKPIAVIGAKGFIGKYLVKMLTFEKYQVIPIDQEDSLQLLEKVDFVITSASVSSFINASYIRKNHVVIDLGFEINKEGYGEGNLTSEAFNKVYYATPVPGGMGPAQMSILIERYMKRIQAR